MVQWIKLLPVAAAFIGVLVEVLAAPLLIQASADVPGKAQGMSQVLGPHSHLGDP